MLLHIPIVRHRIKLLKKKPTKSTKSYKRRKL